MMKSFICALLVCLMLVLPFSVFAEAEPEIGDQANSWRYTNGVLTGGSILRTQYEASHPDATLQGIDVSHHQGEIDWEKVKADGVDFAIIRCGYGMDQTDQDDRYFEYNASECERLGIPYGVYIYSYADTVERASSEADHALRLLQGHTLSYPVFYDMEDDSVVYVGNDGLAAIATTFCDKITAAGYPVGIYANTYWWNTYLTDPVFDNWYRWVAQYHSTCTYQGEYAMWQYSCTGSVNGISGNVDLNFQIGWPDDHGTNNPITLTADRQVYDFLDPIYVSANYRISGTWIGMYKKGEAYSQNDSTPVLRCTLTGETPINIRAALSESERADDFGVGDYTIVLFRDSMGTVLKTVNISITKKVLSQDRVEATCSQEGSVTTTYSDGSVETQLLPKLAHTEESVSGRDAGCTDTGLTEGTRCAVCKTILVAQTTTNALGHRWDEGTVTREPSPDAPGLLTFRCTVCGEIRTDDIPYEAPLKDTVLRISGADRIGTALAVAAKLKETLGVRKFDAIIIAAGGTGGDQNTFADALSGSYLASVKKAPILLYTRGNLAEENLSFIKENLRSNGIIYLLGGNAAIPDTVADTLTQAGYRIKRLGGEDRYDTNRIILTEAGMDTADEILIATGLGFADSLSASATGLPIMLVRGNKSELTESQIEFLLGMKGKKITILGGHSAVSAALEESIEKLMGSDAERICGETREETSALIARKFFAEANLALIAYSRNYPDGLAGGVLANAMGAPLLLTNSGKEAIANAYIEETAIDGGYILGGTAVITDKTAKAVFGQT